MDEFPADAGSASQEPAIPDKLFFRIGEVSQMVGVEPHVLRYWESEFRGLSPKKSSSGQRMFRKKDVDLLLEIKRLLYGRKFTIEGARRALQERSRETNVSKSTICERQLQLFQPDNVFSDIRREIAEILNIFAPI